VLFILSCFYLLNDPNSKPLAHDCIDLIKYILICFGFLLSGTVVSEMALRYVRHCSLLKLGLESLPFFSRPTLRRLQGFPSPSDQPCEREPVAG